MTYHNWVDFTITKKCFYYTVQRQLKYSLVQNSYVVHLNKRHAFKRL